ncbi:hypothetical protein BC938DRAFT_476259 [Jimgerdemannia flammicorona]|uniref:Uncharacterized protein n=1 Tax=Jimgerdemannia flammicorona TaxID=994334 RepID=A0A433PIU9_9FUNG|nr:hypothetical protein BC938DRAFT_476259 [Jimgerdemannia flammicorona]
MLCLYIILDGLIFLTPEVIITILDIIARMGLPDGFIQLLLESVACRRAHKTDNVVNDEYACRLILTFTGTTDFYAKQEIKRNYRELTMLPKTPPLRVEYRQVAASPRVMGSSLICSKSATTGQGSPTRGLTQRTYGTQVRRPQIQALRYGSFLQF